MSMPDMDFKDGEFAYQWNDDKTEFWLSHEVTFSEAFRMKAALDQPVRISLPLDIHSARELADEILRHLPPRESGK